MKLVEALLLLPILYCAFWALYLVGLPLAAGIARWRSSSGVKHAIRTSLPRILVIIPVHNSSGPVARCIEALRAASDYPAQLVEILAVCDHCTDDTSESARNAGALVLERDTGPPGKTYTIGWTLDQLSNGKIIDRQPDLYLIVDSTAVPDRYFIAQIATRWQEGEDIIVGRAAIDPESTQWFVQCMGLTLMHRATQNQAREALHLSSLIEGRGMAYSSNYINRFGWSLALPSEDDAVHPTEDWRHGVQVVEHDMRVCFAEHAVIQTPLRDSLGDATRQGIRWEQGRMLNAGSNALRLLRSGFKERNTRKIIGALDAIQPPVAVLFGMALLLLLVVVALGASMATSVLSMTVAGVASLYGVAIVARGVSEGIHPAYVAWAPIYICWRCLAFAAGWVAGAKNASRVSRGQSGN